MSLQDDFKTFLSDIEPSKTTVDSIASAHDSLRAYLEKHDDYSGHCVKTYLSGSYAKYTCIRPVSDDSHRDVDIIIETDYETTADSAEVIIELRDVLLESKKYESAHVQTHSVGIELATIDIDIVPLASEGERRFIGCIDDASWTETNPKGHIDWSSEVNREHDGKYKPVVKIMKWWRREKCPEGERWPKGITLEKVIADNFPDEDAPYEDLIIGLMENIVDSLTEDVGKGLVPKVVDPVFGANNLSIGYTNSDFRGFLSEIDKCLGVIQESGSCNESWREIFGSRFPAGAKSHSSASLTLMPVSNALRVAHRQAPPWPMAKKRPGVVVVAEVTFPDGHIERISNNGRTIPKNCGINYLVLRSKGLSSLTAKWQVVNTGADAYAANCPRGGFESSNIRNGGRHEASAYAGRHYVQCFLIKNGICVAYSNEFFINIE